MIARSPGRMIRLAIALSFFSLAPTAGDIGSCSQPEDDLDPVKFWQVKQAIDCQRCTDCAIPTMSCDRACAPGLLFNDFPALCVPIEHDGEVCLDALAAASCGDYRSFMSDDAPTIPTECDFCPVDLTDAGGPHPIPDAGTSGAGGGDFGGGFP